MLNKAQKVFGEKSRPLGLKAGPDLAHGVDGHERQVSEELEVHLADVEPDEVVHELDVGFV